MLEWKKEDLNRKEDVLLYLNDVIDKKECLYNWVDSLDNNIDNFSKTDLYNIINHIINYKKEIK